MNVEVAVLGSLILCMVSVDVKQHLRKRFTNYGEVLRHSSQRLNITGCCVRSGDHSAV